MASRFFGVVVAQETGKKYSVAIKDSAYSDTPVEITIQNCIISNDGQNNDRTQPILSASATAQIVIDSAALETLLEDIAGSEEGRFTLSVLDLSAVNLKFEGYILPDLVSIPDQPYQQKYVIQLKATDGLSRLKTIDYNNAGTAYTGYATVLDHVFNCLNKLTELVASYSVSDDFLKVIFNWYETSRTYSATENTLTKVRNNHVAYYEIDSKGNYNFKSCYKVLTEICEVFGMRMYFSDGTYWLEQIGELIISDLNTKRIFTYKKNQTESVANVDRRISNYQADLDTTSQLARLAGGEYTFFPSLKKTVVRYAHRSTVNMLAGKVFDDLSSAATYANVDYYGGSSKLAYSGTLTVSIDELGTETTVFAVFDIKVNVGNYYLQRDVNFTGTWFNYGSTVWSTNNSAVYKVAVPLSAENIESVFSIPIFTPSLIESGDLEFDINISLTKKENGQNFTEIHSVAWTVENNSLELLGIGSFSGQADIKEYAASNTDTSNSAMVEVDTILGDGPGLTSPGHLMVLEDDDTTWSITDNWRVGNSGDPKNVSQLLANELIKGQLTPVKKFVGTFKNLRANYEAWKVIDIYGTYWVFNGGTFDLRSDRISGEWFQIQVATGYTEETPIERPAGQQSSSSPANTVPSSPSSGGSDSGATLKPYWQDFTSPASATVTITKNGGVLPSSDDAIIVSVDGRAIPQSSWSKSGADITIGFPIYSDNIISVFFVI